MTFDEFKDYTRAALELAGDSTPETKAAIVIAAIQSKHVLMPSDIAQVEQARADSDERGYAIRTARGAGSLAGAVPPPRIG